MISRIKKDKKADPFLRPVDQTVYHTYSQRVSKPMDLGTIENNLSSNNYHTLLEFVQDVKMIWENCAKFNGENFLYTKYAKYLDGKFNDMMQKMPEVCSRLASLFVVQCS